MEAEDAKGDSFEESLHTTTISPLESHATTSLEAHPTTSSSLEDHVLCSESAASVVTDENVGFHHHQETVVNNSEKTVSEDLPDDVSMNENTHISSGIVNESVISVEDVTPLSSEVHSIPAPHLLDASIEELDEVPQHLQNGTSGNAGVLVDGNYIVSDEPRETEDSINMFLEEYNRLQVEVTSIETKIQETAESSECVQEVDVNRVLIDTAAPFESVKEAVSKFGETVDWKAHKAQIVERRKNIQEELEKIQEEIPEYKKKTEVAEVAKAEVLRDLDSTKRLIEELKLGVERAETEEVQAKQDSELTQLRVKELEQGIANDASVAAKAQLDVSKARYEAAVAELNSVSEELEALRGQYGSLVTERDIALQKAKDARAASKEIEKTVEDLTLELITAKKSLESAHTSHLESEEHRIGVSLAREQDCINWEKELKQAEEEEQRLNAQLLLGKDLKSKLDAASALVHDLKAELAAYMESKLNQESDIIGPDDGDKTKTQSLVSFKKELEEVNAKIEKAKEEINCLRAAESSLKVELDREKEALTTIRQREGMASLAVSSLESEINRTKQELELVLAKEKDAREKTTELPKLVQQAAQEADQGKSVVQLAREELRKAKEESALTKAGASTMEIRLLATLKEIEASKASEKLALNAVAALQESELSIGLGGEDSPRGVTLPLEEYHKLSKRAHEAEELANKKVTAAISQIEAAKESEARSLERLEEAHKEMEERKEALKIVSENAEKAQEGKLNAEQELRTWRAEHEVRRRASDVAPSASNPSTPKSCEASTERNSVDEEPTPNVYMPEFIPENVALGTKVKKKKSFFPRIVMFLARKKAQSLK